MRKLIMLISFGLVSLGLLLPGLASAGHGYDRDLITAAKNLDYAARHLHEDLHYQARYGRITERARSFTRATSRFCDQVAYSRGGRKLWTDYERLARRFEALSYEASHGNRHIRREFNQVARAFNYVRRAMQGQRRYRGYDRYDDRYRHGQRSRSRFYLSWNR